MKRKILIAVMALAVSLTAVPASIVSAGGTEETTTTTEKDEDGTVTTTTTTTKTDDGTDSKKDGSDSFDAETDDIEDDDDDEEPAGELTKYDIRTTPSKKTIKIGKTFYINVVAQDDSEWEDYSDEEWEEICEENIDSITFRSSKSSVASVNKTTGKVKGKKKGTAVIKTTISLVNGETAVYKTKVYVTK